jgi:hypothetical protein
MGWKDLFKAKPPKTEPDPRLRWFGKLPTYADYYSSATNEEWAVEFNEWILKGFEVYMTRQRSESRDARLPSSACVIRLPKSGMTAFASIQDYGGDMRGRPFPLCFYVGVPSARWPGPTSDRMLPALRVLRDLTALRERVFRFFNNPGRFEVSFAGQELDLTGLDDTTHDVTWETGAQALEFSGWFEAVRSCLKVDELETWFRLAAEWGDNITRLDSDEFGPTLRFPLVMATPFEIQVTGWLRWLERRMKLDERLLSLLFCKDPSGKTGRLSIVARAVVPEDFLLLTSAAGSLAYVDDMCALSGGEPKADDSATGAPVVARAAVRVPKLWSDFVDSTVTT